MARIFLNLLSTELKEDLKKAFEAKFLRCRFSWLVVVIVAAAMFLIYPAWNGTIALDGITSDKDRTVEIYRVMNGTAATTPLMVRRLAARSTARISVTTGLLGSADYKVKVSGLPAAMFRVGWFAPRTEIVVPEKLLESPVVVLRPHAKILAALVQRRFNLILSVDGRKIPVTDDYAGEAIWVGAARDVEIPDRLTRKWSVEMLASGIDAAHLSVWAHPLSASFDAPLKAGMKFESELRNRENNNLFAAASGTVAKSPGSEGFPQEAVINAVTE